MAAASDLNSSISPKQRRFHRSITAAVDSLKTISTSYSALAIVELINHDKYKSKNENILVVTDHDDLIIRYILICGPKNMISSSPYPAYPEKIWANDSTGMHFNA